MPPKRKASTIAQGETPLKRHTRSSAAPLSETQPSTRPTRARIVVAVADPSPTTQRIIRTYGKARRRAVQPIYQEEPLKENRTRSPATVVEAESSDNDSEDELLLSPEKTRTASPLIFKSTSIPFVELTSRRGSHMSGSQPPTPQPPRPRIKPMDPILPPTPSVKPQPEPVSDRTPKSSLKTRKPPPPSTPSKRQSVYLPNDRSLSPASSIPASPLKTRQHSLAIVQPEPQRQQHRPSTPPPQTPKTPHASPSKLAASAQSSPTRIPRGTLPHHLHTCFNRQKRAILHALHEPQSIYDADEDDPENEEAEEEQERSTNEAASSLLNDLLVGTVTRGEGNSCLLLGPRGSGKSQILNQCLSTLPDKPIVIRLSGWVQRTDRHAMREIAYQLSQQTGSTFLSPDDQQDLGAEDAEEANPFIDTALEPVAGPSATFPPPSHLPALISVIPSLGRPTIVVLDAFDLFTLHPRQSLLYCLMDTAQSCRAGAGSKGIAVVGMSSRVDTVDMLEKRVKSRFSGRMFRTAPPLTVDSWMKFLRRVLSARIEDGNTDGSDDGEGGEWDTLWAGAVDKFLEDHTMYRALSETFAIARDLKTLNRIMIGFVANLTPSSAFPSAEAFLSAVAAQRAPTRFPFLHSLSYPSICLLISSVHCNTAGHPTFTFAMLHDYFRDQVRSSTAAPVQVNGGSIGMVKCTREVLMSAFEELVTACVFVSTVPPSSNLAKEFIKYRSVLEKDQIKKAVDKIGQVNLRKWLNRAQ